jgi:hypothetical protein
VSEAESRPGDALANSPSGGPRYYVTRTVIDTAVLDATIPSPGESQDDDSFKRDKTALVVFCGSKVVSSATHNSRYFCYFRCVCDFDCLSKPQGLALFGVQSRY